MSEFNSEMDIQKDILKEFGGDPTQRFDSPYDVQIAILDAVKQGGGGGLTPEQVREIIETYNYATEEYVDDKIGDINAALEAIIGA